MSSKLAIAWLVLALTCRVAAADVIADCGQVDRPEIGHRACTEIIDSSSFGLDKKALAYRYRGEMHTNAGALQPAIADFTDSIRLNKENASAFAGRGWAQFNAGNLAGSIADYTEAIRLSPAAADLYIRRGHVFIVSAKPDAAIRDLTVALRLDPSRSSAFNTRGLAHFKQGDFVKGRGDYTAAQENYAAALDDYTAAIAINPINSLYYANRGYLHEAQGRMQNAIDDLQMALRLDPSQIEASKSLKRLGAADAIPIEAEQRIRQGEALAVKHCSSCHSVGAGVSPDKNAPEFRILYQRHPNIALRAPITQGLAAMHDKMPQAKLSYGEIDAIVAYISSFVPQR